MNRLNNLAYSLDISIILLQLYQSIDVKGSTDKYAD
jgi:hypothetical protein